MATSERHKGETTFPPLKILSRIVKELMIKFGGDDQSRTGDPFVANEVLFQLSYIPTNLKYYTTVRLIQSR